MLHVVEADAFDDGHVAGRQWWQELLHLDRLSGGRKREDIGALQTPRLQFAAGCEHRERGRVVIADNDVSESNGSGRILESDQTFPGCHSH